MKVVDRDTAAQTKHPCFVFAHSYILVRVLLDVEGKPKKYHNMFKGPSPHPSHPPLIFFVPYIWVLLKPPALSGWPLALVSAAASSSGSVPSGNILMPHNVRPPPPPQKFCKVLPQIKRKAGDPQFENPNVQMESIQSKRCSRSV